MEGHIDKHFDEQLGALMERLVSMGGHCERMIALSTRILAERDLRPSNEVFEIEREVNQLHLEIDDRCIKLFALRTPVAGDLRAIIAALKINNDLERIGDQACNIAQNSMDLLKSPRQGHHEGLKQMTALAAVMVKEALDSFVKKDLRLAESVMTKEVMIDALKGQVFEEELVAMGGNSGAVREGMDRILIARNLEKIGDHATNIAEDVVFMVKGKDIRHHKSQSEETVN